MLSIPGIHRQAIDSAKEQMQLRLSGNGFRPIDKVKLIWPAMETINVARWFPRLAHRWFALFGIDRLMRKAIHH